MNFHIENANDSTQHAAGFFGNPTQHGYPDFLDYMRTPIPPPPPPKRSYKTPLILIASLLIVLVVLSSVFLYILIGKYQQVAPHLSLTPTSAPALTQTPIPTSVSTSTPLVVKYYASDIYGDFVAYGLGGTKSKTDTNWGCCTYVPQGGAIAWTDQTTGYTIDIATFTSSTVAHIDEGQLNKEGFSTNVVYNCLLSYESAFPQSLINRYLQVMATYCN